MKKSLKCTFPPVNVTLPICMSGAGSAGMVAVVVFAGADFVATAAGAAESCRGIMDRTTIGKQGDTATMAIP